MIGRHILIAALPLLLLGGCNSNTAPGNDREAGRDPAPEAAPRMGAAQALAGAATGVLQAETMNGADIAALGGADGKCLIRLTRIGFPSFVHTGMNGAGAIKLNGKLIPMSAQRSGLFADGELRVAVRPLDTERDADGVRAVDLIVMLPGAKDELGYRGYEDCSHRAA
jgi:hypothetical protein